MPLGGPRWDTGGAGGGGGSTDSGGSSGGSTDTDVDVHDDDDDLDLGQGSSGGQRYDSGNSGGSVVPDDGDHSDGEGGNVIISDGDGDSSNSDDADQQEQTDNAFDAIEDNGDIPGGVVDAPDGEYVGGEGAGDSYDDEEPSGGQQPTESDDSGRPAWQYAVGAAAVGAIFLGR